MSCSSGEERSGTNGVNIGALLGGMGRVGCGDLMGAFWVGSGEEDSEEEDEDERLERCDEMGVGYWDGCGSAFARPQLLVNGWVANGSNEPRDDADWVMVSCSTN